MPLLLDFTELTILLQSQNIDLSLIIIMIKIAIACITLYVSQSLKDGKYYRDI